MEPFAQPDDAAESRRGIIIGVGNPYYGDDAIGLLVARAVHRRLAQSDNWTLAELSCSAFGVIEHLEGYQRALIVDALVDEEAAPGTLVQVAVPEGCSTPHTGFHTVAFGDAMALARTAGLSLPERISFYAVVIRPPQGFADRLSPELEARIEELATAIVEAEQGSGR